MSDSKPGGGNAGRWTHLVELAFHLDERLGALESDGELTPADAEIRRLSSLRTSLDHLLEVFDERLDPVKDLEGYAVRRLALTLKRALEPKRRASTPDDA